MKFTKLPSVATNAQPYVDSFLHDLEIGLVTKSGDTYRHLKHPYVYARDSEAGGLVIYLTTARTPIGTAR
jgi:hypothetical protein